MHRRGTVLAACLLLLALLAGGGAALARGGPAEEAVPAAAVAVPQLLATSVGADGAQPWDAPLELTAADGTLVAVTALRGEDPLDGAVDGGTWRSTGGLVPSSAYRLTGTVRDTAGREVQRPLVVRTGAASAVLTAGTGARPPSGRPARRWTSAPSSRGSR